MQRIWLAAIIPGALAVGFAVFVLALLVVKALWAWTIPDLFPGGVKQGLIAGTISWYTSLKVAIFVGMMGAIAGMHRGEGKKG